jgi:subtilase family serine protease
MNKREVYCSANIGRLRTMGLFVVAVALVAGMTLPATAGQLIAHNTPAYVNSAKNLGAVDASTTMDVTIWLNPHNRAEMDQLVKDLYDRTSPVYRQWLKRGDIAARFAPTANEAKTVQNYFEAHNLKVVTVGPNNFFVRARGTAGNVQTAFHVQLNNYEVNGEVLRANDRDPSVDDEATSALVHSVQGLDSGHYTHPLAEKYAGTKKPITQTTSKGADSFFTTNCFDGTITEKFATDGTYPVGTYSGNNYYAYSNLPGCAYTPPEIYTAYNLNGLYSEGFNGAGQTIAIIDWCGSLTAESDGNVFNKKFGLPLFTSSNFTTIYTPTPSSCAAPDPEINIDTQWAHAIAPGANIDLVVPPSANFDDVDQGFFYAVNYDLGNVVSGSYGAPESLVSLSILDTESLIAEIGAITGISAQFATGDEGDYTDYGIPPTVSTPADSPYATGVGGVSLALTSSNTIAWQSAWGTDETLLDDEGYLFDPPLAFGFIFGSGGGASGVFPSPSFQSSLGSSWRELPDISWLADPFTGGVIALSEPGETVSFYDYGGTSLATPMFSGLWAIANEEAGVPLGQAAQYLYTLPPGLITDVVPVGSSTNVTASIQQSSTVTDSYDADQVMNLSGTFYSGLWNYPFVQGLIYAVSFGTDSSLAAAPGWDDATGLGTPNGQAFADWFGPSAANNKK